MPSAGRVVALLAAACLGAHLPACKPAEPEDAGADGSGGFGGGGSDSGGGQGGTAAGPSSRVVFDGAGIWAESSPDLGIRGVFFMLEDSVSRGAPVSDGLMHTDLTADSAGDETQAPFSQFTSATLEPCVSGSLPIVTLYDGSPCDPVEDECAWDSIWGGGIGMHLNQASGASSAAEPWDATAYGVSGFEFTTTGDIGQAILRFKAKDSAHPDEDFCAMVPMGAERRVLLSRLKHQCWNNEGSLTLDVTRLTSLEWQIVPDTDSSHEVTSFCIAHVGAF